MIPFLQGVPLAARATQRKARLHQEPSKFCDRFSAYAISALPVLPPYRSATLVTRPLSRYPDPVSPEHYTF